MTMYAGTRYRVRCPAALWWVVDRLCNPALRRAGLPWRVYVLGEARSYLTLCARVGL